MLIEIDTCNKNPMRSLIAYCIFKLELFLSVYLSVCFEFSFKGRGDFRGFGVNITLLSPRPPRKLKIGQKVYFDGIYTYFLELLKSEVINLIFVVQKGCFEGAHEIKVIEKNSMTGRFGYKGIRVQRNYIKVNDYVIFTLSL